MKKWLKGNTFSRDFSFKIKNNRRAREPLPEKVLPESNL